MAKRDNARPLQKPLTQDDVDQLRQDFARRMKQLIGVEKDVKNLENFSRKCGIALRQLSEWSSKRHLNWPSVPNLIRISRAAGVSIDWLLTGKD